MCITKKKKFFHYSCVASKLSLPAVLYNEYYFNVVPSVVTSH